MRIHGMKIAYYFHQPANPPIAGRSVGDNPYCKDINTVPVANPANHPAGSIQYF
jgi:hypothetical protein